VTRSTMCHQRKNGKSWSSQGAEERRRMVSERLWMRMRGRSVYAETDPGHHGSNR
jgi:hypothetical protein